MSEETSLVIESIGATLEARLLAQGNSVGLIMCHPHPLFSGTMDNKVVTSAIRAARDLGFNTLRFNFRGVGKSSGQHDKGIGEQDDVAAVVRYARDQLGWEKVILAGFSFGAGIACLEACRHPDLINALFLIAPAVHHFDAPSVLPWEFDTWVLMGDTDEVVPFDEVDSWVQRLVPQPHWLVFKDTGHFFHGRLIDLRDSLKCEFKQIVE